MSPPVAALGGNDTSPLDPVRCAVVSVSGHGGIPPCPRTTKLSRGVRGSCGTRPLRPPASLLHNAALLSASASQSQAPFVAATASRPSGESNRRYAKLPTLERSHSRRRFPVSSCPTRRRLRALVAVMALWHQSGAARCLLGQWPTASHVVCAPAHPSASPLRGISPARWSARPPPVGAPSARAPLFFGLATGLVAGHARNTGATGLTACKPAWPLAYFFRCNGGCSCYSFNSCLRTFYAG